MKQGERKVNNAECFIIGLTGPIAAGFTTLAETIIKMTKLVPPRKLIDRLELLTKVEEQISQLRNKKLDGLVDEEERYRVVKELKKRMQERVWLQALRKAEKINFKRISMSEIIVQLCFENLEIGKEWANQRPVRLKIYEEMKKHSDTYEKVLSY